MKLGRRHLSHQSHPADSLDSVDGCPAHQDMDWCDEMEYEDPTGAVRSHFICSGIPNQIT